MVAEGLRAHDEVLHLREALSERDAHIKMLDKTLEERDVQLAKLKAQCLDILKRYDFQKEEFHNIIWNYLPQHAPDFRLLRVDPDDAGSGSAAGCAAAGCVAVRVESDSRVDDVRLHGVLGAGRFGKVHLGLVDGPEEGGTPLEVVAKAIPKDKIRSLGALLNLVNEIKCMRFLTEAAAAETAASARNERGEERRPGGGGGDRRRRCGLDHVVKLRSASVSCSTVYLTQSMGGADLYAVNLFCAEVSGDPNARLPVVIVEGIARGLFAAIAAIHEHGWCVRATGARARAVWCGVPSSCKTPDRPLKV